MTNGRLQKHFWYILSAVRAAAVFGFLHLCTLRRRRFNLGLSPSDENYGRFAMSSIARCGDQFAFRRSSGTISYRRPSAAARFGWPVSVPASKFGLVIGWSHMNRDRSPSLHRAENLGSHEPDLIADEIAHQSRHFQPVAPKLRQFSGRFQFRIDFRSQPNYLVLVHRTPFAKPARNRRQFLLRTRDDRRYIVSASAA